MDRRRLALLCGVPLVGLLIVAAALSMRKEGPSTPERAPGRRTSAGSAVAAQVVARTEPRPQPAAEKTVAQQSEVVRIRSTYQSYRTAVATGNSTLAQAILPALARDRSEAVQLAEADLVAAGTDFDRTVARKVLEGLKR